MTELRVLRCELDEAGLRAQRDRYAEIGAGTVRIDREPTRLTAELGERVDPSVVDETLRVERGCCPFFELGYDRDARRLEVAVADAAHAPALDAIEHALRGG